MVLRHTEHNEVAGHFGDIPCWPGMEKKQDLTQQKHTFTNQKKRTTTQNKPKPDLVACYDIRPGNGEGLFWFWNFINGHLLT